MYMSAAYYNKPILPSSSMEPFPEPQVNQYGNHMVMTNVYKPKKTKYLNVDTRFTDEYVYPNSGFNNITTYSITLPERVNNIKSMKIRNVEIPMSFYNISAALGNSHFKLATSPTSFQMIILPDGQYSASDLSNQILSKASTALSASTVSNTNYYSITPKANYELDFNTDICGNIDKYNVRSKLGWVLGFRDPSYTLITATQLTAPSMINPNTVRYLYLVVDEFNNSFPNSFFCPQNQYMMNKKVLGRIAVDNIHATFGTVLVGNESNGILVTDKRMYSGSVDIQRLQVQLVNEWGVPMNLNGQDFSFVLEIECE
jgi:hypothetical protein